MDQRLLLPDQKLGFLISCDVPNVIENIKKIFEEKKEPFDPIQLLGVIVNHPSRKEICLQLRNEEELIYLLRGAVLKKASKFHSSINYTTFIDDEQLCVLYKFLSEKIPNKNEELFN